MSELANLAAALVALQAALPEVKKDRTAKVKTKAGDTYSYEYADLYDVSRVILPALSGHGLSFLAMPTFNDAGRFVLRYRLLHISGESIGGDYPLRDDGTPQAVGGFITYARRYCLCAVTGLAPEGEDDDAAMAQEEATGPARTARRARPGAQSNAERPTAQRGARQTEPPAIGKTAALGVIATQLATIGVKDRASAYGVMSQYLGRPVTATGDVTDDEARDMAGRISGAAASKGGVQAFVDRLNEEAEERAMAADQEGGQAGEVGEPEAPAT